MAITAGSRTLAAASDRHVARPVFENAGGRIADSSRPAVLEPDQFAACIPASSVPAMRGPGVVAAGRTVRWPLVSLPFQEPASRGWDGRVCRGMKRLTLPVLG